MASETPPRFPWQRYLPMLVPLLFVYVVIELAIIKKEIAFSRGVLLILFITFSVYSFFSFFEMVDKKKDSLGVQRDSPGIDGSAGGWRLTPALTMLLVTILFAVPVVMLSLDSIGKPSAPAAAAKDSTASKDTVIVDEKKPANDSNVAGIKLPVVIDTTKKINPLKK